MFNNFDIWRLGGTILVKQLSKGTMRWVFVRETELLVSTEEAIGDRPTDNYAWELYDTEEEILRST